ncbi:DUF6284 family protein [Cryptosporangium aurantiacum]|uniref:Uncharacterized protein n=1 Tax=Cryptosporangium aurantiacum TaxID=134849 RepID=A0A1M7NMF7_9ACTN|nr:DUF6284 family protein [Cryptosporangium aurantiacum]SHN05122.1 hypothetical protein SAMN05443668_102727 [Cryptosporangium aurantiacum]
MSSKSNRRRRLGSVELSDREPTCADLAAIEVEWPVIAAEIDVVDAMTRMARAEAGPTELDWQALRSAERRVLAEARKLANAARRSITPEVA